LINPFTLYDKWLGSAKKDEISERARAAAGQSSGDGILIGLL
jgi:hypothetical protein